MVSLISHSENRRGFPLPLASEQDEACILNWHEIGFPIPWCSWLYMGQKTDFVMSVVRAKFAAFYFSFFSVFSFSEL